MYGQSCSHLSTVRLLNLSHGQYYMASMPAIMYRQTALTKTNYEALSRVNLQQKWGSS